MAKKTPKTQELPLVLPTVGLTAGLTAQSDVKSANNDVKDNNVKDNDLKVGLDVKVKQIGDFKFKTFNK
jgi:hypothetical protein